MEGAMWLWISCVNLIVLFMFECAVFGCIFVVNGWDQILLQLILTRHP